MNNWKFDLLTGLGEVSAMQDVVDIATNAVEALGFNYCGWLAPLAEPLPTIPCLCFASTEEQIHEHVGQGALDNAAKQQGGVAVPYMWTGINDDHALPLTPEPKNAAQHHRHRGGWAQVTQLRDGMRYLFYTDSRNEVPMEQLKQCSPDLQWVAAAVHARMQLFRDRNTLTLTLREQHILKELGAGEALEAISQHMQLSQETVDFHLENALFKLETPDIRTAAAQASFRGLLR